MPENTPLTVKNLFWEYNTTEINLNKHKPFVVERILEKGNFESIKWLFKLYSISDIRKTIAQSSNISQKTLDFWQNFFKFNYNA
jgi:hypothetical protein